LRLTNLEALKSVSAAELHGLHSVSQTPLWLIEADDDWLELARER
jgi:hypothetical protein